MHAKHNRIYRFFWITFSGLLFALLFPMLTYAAVGDINVIVQDQLGNSLPGATVTANCNGTPVSVTDGSDGDLTSNGTINILAATLITASCLTNGESISQLDVSKDGYVTGAASGDLVWNSVASNDDNVSLQFGHKVTAQTELGGSLTGATVSIGGTSCTESSGIYYCATPVASDGGTSDVSIAKDGYVTYTANSTNRANNAAAQATYTSSNPFAYKITSISTEVLSANITGSVTGFTVGDATGQNTCSLNGGAWYCPVTLANSDAEPGGTPTLDGYVSETIDLVGSATRTLNSSAQVSTTLTAVKYAHKVTAQTELGGGLSGSTVSIGGTSCTESSGIYYCATPLSADGGTNDVSIAKDGYVTYLANSTNRSSSTSSQASYTSSNLFAYKITSVVTEVLGVEIKSNLTSLNVGDSTGKDACIYSSNQWYCAVLLVDSDEIPTVTLTGDGFVSETLSLVVGSVRLSATASQVSTSVAGVKYAQKVTGNDELGSTLSGATVTVGGTSCTESSAVYYCATPIASDGGVNDVIIIKDGFVTFRNNSTNRTASTDPQAVYVSSNAFAYKITGVTTETLAANVVSSLVSITVGDDSGQSSCIQSSGTWYCAVLLANSDSALTATPTLNGYVTEQLSLSNDGLRTSNLDAQVVTTVLNFKYAHKVTAQTELGGSISGATVSVGGTSCTENAGVYFCATPLANDGGTSDVIITKDGYVTYLVNSTDRASNAAAQATYTSTNLFAYKITAISTETFSTNVASSLTGLTVGDGTGQNTCVLGSGVWYCPVVLANSDAEPSGTPTIDGYVSETIDLVGTGVRTAGTSGQVSTTIISLKYAHKVTAQTELGGSFTGGTVSVGGTSCVESSGVYFCATPVASDGGTNDVSIEKDGYVTYLSDSTDRASNAASQATYNSTNLFSHKVTVHADTGESLTTATVTVAGISCSGSGGTYYCVVPIASDGGSSDVHVVLSGFVEAFQSSVDRTIGSSSQGSYTFTLSRVSTPAPVEETGGGSGRGIHHSSTTSSSTSSSSNGDSSTNTSSDSATSTSTVASSVFGDVTGHWAETYINTLYSLGIVEGESATQFAPDRPLTRAEMVKIVLLAKGVTIQSDAQNTFPDVSADAWYIDYIATARELGIVRGYDDGEFRPDQSVNRAEALKMVINAFALSNNQSAVSSFVDSPQDAWYAPFVNEAYADGIVSGKGEGRFAPADFITRGEMAKVVVLTMGVNSN